LHGVEGTVRGIVEHRPVGLDERVLHSLLERPACRGLEIGEPVGGDAGRVPGVADVATAGFGRGASMNNPMTGVSSRHVIGLENKEPRARAGALSNPRYPR
jgi:hypothetical protein